MSKIVVPAAAQYYWPKPAAQPANPVCAGCISPKTGLLTPGYPTVPISGFVGRFLDSQAVQDFQQPVRTLRAFQILEAPTHNRIYMIIGSALFAYDESKFFSRLLQNETLTQSPSVPYSAPGYFPHSAPYEEFLKFDEFFYAENEPSNGWVIQITDGQERLFGMDYDDQGYVYLAYSFYGWGIVKDDGTDNGTLMQSQYQYTGSDATDAYPARVIAALKGSNGHYYAVVSDQSLGLNVFDVTSRTAPTRLAPMPSKSMFNFARTPAADRIGIATTDGKLQIYTTDSLVANGAPMFETTGVGGAAVHGVATDGTNFYATSDTPNGLVISVFTPVGNTYRRLGDYPSADTTFATTQHLSYGSGYLTWAGTETGAANLRVFKLTNGAPTEVNFSIPNCPSGQCNYLQRYYIAAPTSAYAKPSFSYFWDSNVIKQGTHTYLLALGYSLGDVYELPSTDTVSVANNGVLGTPNTSIPAGSGTGPFPGDPIGFTATTLAQGGMILTWNFGDGTSAPGATGTQIMHQYAGAALAGAASKNLSVSATNVNDSSITSSATVTLNTPVARFGFGNYKYLFLQPDASSAAPVVAGDSFFDASDGTVQGHYGSWTLDGVVQPGTVPPAGPGVGACGAHTMNFAANYGAYTTPPPSTSGPTSIGFAVTYDVRPFAAAIDTPQSAAYDGVSCTDQSGCVKFNSLARIASDPNSLTSAQAAALTYRWELLNGSGAPVLQQSGNAPQGSVPAYYVGKSQFTGSNFKVHLLMGAPGGVGSGCAAMTTSNAYSGALNPPDPQITGGCTGVNNGPPCSFSVTSPGGADTSTWSLAWSAVPTTGVTPSSATGPTYAPNFGTQGSYYVQVTATNSIGSTPARTATFTVPGITCATIRPGLDVFINYSGPQSLCNQNSGTCYVGESLAFSAATFGYDFSCDPNTSFTWNFGDGASGSGQSLAHTYATANNYTATLTLKNTAYQSGIQMTQLVKVGGSVTPPPPPPPPPPPTGGVCQTMNANNTFISYTGPKSGCSPYPNAPPCQAGENVSLSVQFFSPYDPTCAVHNYNWSFGGNTQAVTHAFSATTPIYVNISNGSQTFQATATVTVSGTQPPPPSGACQQMNSSDVFVTYNGPTSGCSYSNTTSCSSSEQVSLGVAFFPPYDVNCAAHSFTWSFGASGQNVTHQFASSSQISVQITNGSQTYTATAQIPVGSGGTPPPGSCGTLIPGTSVFVSYTGPQSGCTSYNSSPCSTSETLPFAASAFSPFSLSCITAYDWNYGDGTPHGTGASAPHRYVTAGSYPLKLTVTYSGQPYIVSQTVNVSGTPTPTTNFQFDFTTSAIPNVPNGYIFKAFPTTTGASAAAYNWDFGDGQVCQSTQSQPCGDQQAHIYADSKDYTVTLSVPGVNGAIQHKIDDKFRHRPSAHP